MQTTTTANPRSASPRRAAPISPSSSRPSSPNGPRAAPTSVNPVGPFAAERQRSVRRARLDRTHQGHVRRARARRQARRDPEEAPTSARTSRPRARAARSRSTTSSAAPPFPTARDEARGPQAVRDLQPEGQPLDHRQLSLRALRHVRIGGSTASPRARSPTCSRSVRKRRTFGERVARGDAIPVLNGRSRSAAAPRLL